MCEMKIYESLNIKSAEILKNGGIGVIPTDTIYGIVGSALNKKTVERIYELRKRNLKKPMIILISSINDLKLFGINIDLKTKKILSKIWPNKVSVVISCKNSMFSYLHRGTGSLAFRLPARLPGPRNKKLVGFLKKIGPLVAPSANWEGSEYSKTIKEAQGYFGAKVNFYVDAGTKRSLPSTLIEIRNSKVMVLREGAVKL